MSDWEDDNSMPVASQMDDGRDQNTDNYSHRGGRGGNFSSRGSRANMMDSDFSGYEPRGGRGGNFSSRGSRANMMDSDFSGYGPRGGYMNDHGSRRGGMDSDYSRRGFGSGMNGDSFGRGYKDDGMNGGSSGRGFRGGGRGGGFAGRPDDGDLDGQEARPPVSYIPQEREDFDELFEDTIASGINFAQYHKIPISVTGDNVPKPIATFDEAGLRSSIMKNITRSKYTEPTPVQKHAIPCIMQGRDLMACAQTGSGKTAAFALPIIERLLQMDTFDSAPGNAPQVIIVSPTRELAIQIKDECRKLCFGTPLRCVVVYGGTSTKAQAVMIASEPVHLLVGTPGRLMQFIKEGRISLEAVQFIVLDEADRMLDMGFLPDIKHLMSNPDIPAASSGRQTLMFSATFPDEIQRIANNFLNDYLFLSVGRVGGACTDVAQTAVEVSKFAKRDKLLDLIRDHGEVDGVKQRILVFVETKKNADFLAAFLSQKGHPTTSIHGDRLQNEREEALADFKKGTRPIMVATSVASRGLNIKNVSHVVNYDMPTNVDDYVHRIGRTGRMGHTGRATSFVDPQMDQAMIEPLINILRDSQQVLPDWLAAIAGEERPSHDYNNNNTNGDLAKNSTAVASNGDDDWE